VVLGCIMMRVCHLNTCPVGIATQDPELRKRFAGRADYVVNFFRFLAQEVREHMASLGFRTMDEMSGAWNRLDFKPALEPLESVRPRPVLDPLSAGRARGRARRRVRPQDHALESSLDSTTIVPACREAVEHRKPVELRLPIRNVNRTVGTTLGYHITKRWGGEGLPDDTIRVHLRDRPAGASARSFPAASRSPSRATPTTTGAGTLGRQAHGLPAPREHVRPEDNIVIGTSALYGATSGRGLRPRRRLASASASATAASTPSSGCRRSRLRVQ